MNQFESHGLAHEFFTASINNCSYLSYECPFYENFLNGDCLAKKINYMGLHSNINDATNSKNLTYYLQTSNTKPYCPTFTCQSKNEQGYCTPSNKHFETCKKLTNKECNQKSNNFWCCPFKKEKQIVENDLAIVIDVTNNSKLKNHQFNKTIKFVSSLIKNADVSLFGTRVALIFYSPLNVRTLAYLNEENTQSSLLQKLYTIELETSETANGNTQLVNALKQCQNVFTLKNGMRDYSMGIGKQIILVSGELMSGNSEAVTISKHLIEQGFFKLILFFLS